MKGKDTRKTIKKIRRLCKPRGIEVLVESQRGKGSHVSLIFIDRDTKEFVRVTISGKDEISAGVQRGILRYLEDFISKYGDLAGKTVLAMAVKKILEAIFKD